MAVTTDEQVEAPQGPEVTGLRQATLDDLESIVSVNSAMAKAESGSDPLQRDPEGFRYRTARRIARGRNWIWMEDGKMRFKADIIADTPEVIYLRDLVEMVARQRYGCGIVPAGRVLWDRPEPSDLTVNAERPRLRALTAGDLPCASYTTKLYLHLEVRRRDGTSNCDG